MILRSAFILIAVFFGPVIAFSQSRLDSLENQLDDADPAQRVQIFCDISEIYWQRSFDTSLHMAKRALTLAEEIDDRELTAHSLNMTGIAYYLISDFANALDYYFQAQALNEELEDSSSIGILNINIGTVYLDLKDYQKALTYLKNAENIFGVIGDNTYMFSLLNNIGAAFIDFEQYDTAFVYLTDAYEIALETQNQIDISISLNNLGEVSLKMGLYSRSEEYLVNALEISKRLDDKAMMATVLANLGHLKMEKTEYGTAYELFMESLGYAEAVNSLPDKRETYRYLSEYYEIMNNADSALSYFKLYNAARDSILTEEGLVKIKEMEIKSSAKVLQQEIQFLKLENEINRQKHIMQRILIFFLTLVAVMGFLVFIIYFQKNRFKRRTNILLEEKNRQLEMANKKLKESEQHLKELNSTKDKLFSIIGHDLRNPLNALLGFSELISGNSREYTFEEIQKYSRIINEAAKNIHLLIENLLEWSRSQSGNIEFNPSNMDIYPAIEDILKVFSIQSDKKKIKIDISVPRKTMANFDSNLLSTILRNLVSNAIKFTPKGGKIDISCTPGTKELTLSVRDTGIGMTEEQKNQLFKLNETLTMPGTSEEQGTGLGLILCGEFVDMHGGRIWAESKPGKGSTFSFTLPHPK